jgi:hypothetical protein
MSDAVRCENCHFSMPVANAEGKAFEFGNLACCRYPPMTYVDESDGLVRGRLTMVNHNWWCGEWKARKSSA